MNKTVALRESPYFLFFRSLFILLPSPAAISGAPQWQQAMACRQQGVPMPYTPDTCQYDAELDVEALQDADSALLLHELKKTRRLYEELYAIFEDSGDGFFVTDGQVNVIRVNKAYEEMSGVKREELLGRNMRELEGVTLDKSASLIVMAAGKEVAIEQEYLRTKRTAYITSIPIFDKTGHLAMIVINNSELKEIDRFKRQLEATRELVCQWEEKIRTISSQSMEKSELCVADSRMYEVLYTANKVARTDSPVLITGETGTGKEEVAKYIHQNSPRAGEAFFTINCGAIAFTFITGTSQPVAVMITFVLGICLAFICNLGSRFLSADGSWSFSTTKAR